MPDLSMVSPLLDGMQEEALLSSHDGVRIYRMLHAASGIRCIVKHISIPESKTDTEALYLTGAVKTQEDAVRYYESIVDQYRKELAALRTLSKEPYFCSYARFQVAAKTDQPGFDLYLLAPCRTSLRTYLENNAITQKMALQLGMDLCRGLATLRERGYVHLDLKPENIFLEHGNFCIGDFGLTSIDDLRYDALPARFLSNYTAPEACSVTGSLNETTDLYAVGLLLYYIYNGNHVPFEEAGTTKKMADNRRVSGEALPAPLYADYEMDAIIHKACAFRPEDRYQTPAEFLEALQSYGSRNQLQDECIVPPLVLDDVPLATEPQQEEDETPLSFTDTDTLSEAFKENFTPAQEEPAKEPAKRKPAKWLPITLILVLILAGGFAYLYFVYTAISISRISITEKGTDFLTVSVDASDYSHLAVTCTPDGEGTAVTYRCDETVTFRDLTPGTLYHISVNATDWHYVKGTRGGTAETSAITEILSLTAEDLQNGSVQVTFQVSGPEPETWTLRCSSSSTEDTIYESTEHSFTLDGFAAEQPIYVDPGGWRRLLSRWYGLYSLLLYRSHHRLQSPGSGNHGKFHCRHMGF